MEGRRFFPEQGKIQPPRGMQERGGSTFNVSAPTRHDGVIATPERPTTPTIRSPEPAHQKEPEKPKKHTVRNIVLSGGGLVVAGLGAYETVPAIHRLVDSAFLDHLRGKSQSLSEASTIDPEEIFDNAATKGVVGPKNILYIPQEEFNRLPLADEEGNPIFDFPWDKNHPVEIKYEKTLWPPPDWWKSNPDPNNRNIFEGKDSLPAGFEFPAIYPGRVFFSTDPYNKEKIHMASIHFITPNGILYAVGITINDNRGGALSLEPLINVVLSSPDNRNAKDWEKGILVGRGQTVFRVIQEGKLSMAIQGGKNGRFDGPTIERMPGNFVFQAEKDVAGTKKILVRGDR